MLDFEVIPERSLGCENCLFKLGMPFYQAVEILQKQCRIISSVDVIYIENDPLAGDLILKLCGDGIRLIFDSCSQRLKVMEVYDMTRVKLKYGGNMFCSLPETSPTREQIDLSFGATRPPDYVTQQQNFVLSFRGLSFTFPAAMSKSSERTVPQFPSRSTALVSKMSVFSGNCLSDAKVLELPGHCFNRGVYSNGLDVVREDSVTVGVQVHLLYEGIDSSSSPTGRIKEDTRTICFGYTVQDVLSLLGAPGKVFYKAEDKMKIHAPRDQQSQHSNDRSDYFFNYFTLGLDILFDAVTQRAKKFVLHTNYPGHYDFNIYYRCLFKIPLIRATGGDGVAQTSLLDQMEPMIVTSFSKWDDIYGFIPGHESRPIVLNRTSSVNATNPFGPTYCYGYQDMIFEVMPNGHIASVTLYLTKER